MPNGGDPESCARAGPFHQQVESVLTDFTSKHNLSYTPWYHEIPLFLFEWPTPQDLSYTGVRRCIQVRIDPESADHATVSIFVHAYQDSLGPRRLLSFFIFRGQLPQDKAKLSLYLNIARAVALCVTESDLLDVETWKKVQEPLYPMARSA